MTSLQDIISLAKADGGKFFVIDEQGEARLVIMGIDEYQKMLLGKLQRQILDVEKINREILRAQLTEEISAPKPAAGPSAQTMPQPRARVDLREEVIDPSFDFEGPKMEIDDL